MEVSKEMNAMLDQFNKLSQEFDTNIKTFMHTVEALPKQALLRVLKKTLASPFVDEHIKLEHELEQKAFLLANKIQQNKLGMAIQNQVMTQQANMDQNKKQVEEVTKENEDGEV